MASRTVRSRQVMESDRRFFFGAHGMSQFGVELKKLERSAAPQIFRPSEDYGAVYFVAVLVDERRHLLVAFLEKSFHDFRRQPPGVYPSRDVFLDTRPGWQNRRRSLRLEPARLAENDPSEQPGFGIWPDSLTIQASAMPPTRFGVGVTARNSAGQWTASIICNASVAVSQCISCSSPSARLIQYFAPMVQWSCSRTAGDGDSFGENSSASVLIVVLVVRKQRENQDLPPNERAPARRSEITRRQLRHAGQLRIVKTEYTPGLRCSPSRWRTTTPSQSSWRHIAGSPW